MRSLCTLGLVVLATRGAAAQGARADSASAVAAIDQFHAALAAGDSAKAISLLSDDVYIIETGAIQTRTEYMSSHLGADMRASRAPGPKGERTLVKVTVMGDMAYVVSSTLTPGTDAAGTPTAGSESVELMVVARVGGSWKIKAVHWSSRRRR